MRTRKGATNPDRKEKDKTKIYIQCIHRGKKGDGKTSMKATPILEPFQQTLTLTLANSNREGKKFNQSWNKNKTMLKME